MDQFFLSLVFQGVLKVYAMPPGTLLTSPMRTYKCVQPGARALTFPVNFHGPLHYLARLTIPAAMQKLKKINRSEKEMPNVVFTESQQARAIITDTGQLELLPSLCS
jgi:hypothetical protein